MFYIRPKVIIAAFLHSMLLFVDNPQTGKRIGALIPGTFDCMFGIATRSNGATASILVSVDKREQKGEYCYSESCFGRENKYH